MAAPSRAVHALVDMIFLDSLTIGFAGILCPTVAVDNSTFQRGISSQGVFQCLDTQICSQKAILSKYVFFVDDGFSGTNFNRPGWNELIEKIENSDFTPFLNIINDNLEY